MEEAALLRAVQRHVCGVHVQHQLARRALATAAGNELLQQHPVQRPGLLGCGRGLQPAERRGAGQRMIAAHGRLHGQVRTQHVVVAHVRPPQAQPVHALRHHAGQAVANLAGLPLIAQRSGCSGRQPQALVHAAQQQHAAFTAQIAAAEIRLDQAPTNPPEIDLVVRTLWHRQSSVGIGGEIPMTTRLGTRLPTLRS